MEARAPLTLPLQAAYAVTIKERLGAQQLIELNDAMERLGERHPAWSQVVELHFFKGCSLREISGEILGVARNTVRWRMAEAFLYRELADETTLPP